MLKKRIIPVLLLKNRRMVKGVRFDNYRDTGDPVSAVKVYNSQDADELIFIDIEANKKSGPDFFDLMEKVSRVSFMPLTLGGGIRTIDHIRDCLNAGADKVSITSASFDYDFIASAQSRFGSQCIVVGIDAHMENDKIELSTYSTTKKCIVTFEEHVKRLSAMGIGEIFLNMTDRDGLMSGYNLDLIKFTRNLTSVPLIVNGGAGNYNHLLDGFNVGADAVACSSLFHFADNNPIRAKAFLKNYNINLKRI